jgi:hypothetical protein
MVETKADIRLFSSPSLPGNDKHLSPWMDIAFTQTRRTDNQIF